MSKQIDEIALLLAEINGDSTCRYNAYPNGTSDGSGGFRTDSLGGGGTVISPLPTTPPPRRATSGSHPKKSLKLRKKPSNGGVDGNSNLSMPTFEGHSPELCQSVPSQCPFPGPPPSERCFEALESSWKERDGTSNTDEQTDGGLGEDISCKEETGGLFHRDRVLKYVSSTCLPLLENYVSSWVTRMVEEIVKMNTERSSSLVTALDVGNALEDVWQDQMASWTSYDDDNHGEYLADQPPRLSNILDANYWTMVFSSINDLDTLRLLLNPVSAACVKEYLLCQKRKNTTNKYPLKSEAFRKPYEIRFKQLFEKRLLAGGMKSFRLFQEERLALGHSELDIAYEYSCYRRNFLQQYYQRLGLLTYEQFLEKLPYTTTRYKEHDQVKLQARYRNYRCNWEELRMRGEAIDNDSLCGVVKKEEPPDDDEESAESVFECSAEDVIRPRDLCTEAAVKSSEKPKKKRKVLQAVTQNKRVRFAEEDTPVKKKTPLKKKVVVEEDSPVKKKRRVKLEKPKPRPRKMSLNNFHLEEKDPYYYAMGTVHQSVINH